jgi:hypothetical protein
MDKFITRLTVICVSIYFLVAYIFAQLGIDILTSSYVVLFELCTVSYTFCSGNYHCKYMRWTALSILIVEIINYTDYYFNYIPVSVYNIIPIFILALGMGTSLTLAIKHFSRVNKIKRNRKSYEYRIKRN